MLTCLLAAQVSMIPSGCTLTSREFEARREELKDSSATVVCYCTAGLRSYSYAARLPDDHGFAAGRVYNLEGGILAWTHHGLPLVRRIGCGGQELAETKRVHVYSPGWALQSKGYEPVFKAAFLASLW